MLFEYDEKNMIKNENGEIQYFRQVKPFTFGEMFSGLVSIEKLGNSLMFFSKNTKECIGISNEITMALFEIV